MAVEPQRLTKILTTNSDGMTGFICPNCFVGALKEAKFCWSCGHPLKNPNEEKEDDDPFGK